MHIPLPMTIDHRIGSFCNSYSFLPIKAPSFSRNAIIIRTTSIIQPIFVLFFFAVTKTTVITTTTTEYVSSEENNGGDNILHAATEPIITAVSNNEFASQPIKDKEGKDLVRARNQHY